MVAYSLISCSCDYYSIGIYTSLKQLYLTLKNVVSEDMEFYPKEEIMGFYEIKRVKLNNHNPEVCVEFSRTGKNVPINWKRVFKKER